MRQTERHPRRLLKWSHHWLRKIDDSRKVFFTLLLLISVPALATCLVEVVAKFSGEEKRIWLTSTATSTREVRLVTALACTASDRCLHTPPATIIIHQPLLVVLIICSFLPYSASNSTLPQIVCVLYSPALHLTPRLFPRVAFSCLSCSELS
jgi:hypothetical protein